MSVKIRVSCQERAELDRVNVLEVKKMDENAYTTVGDEELLVRDEQEIRIREYKSAFYQLLAKPDSMTRVYNKNIVIDLDDLYILNDKINDKLKNHQEAGYIINLSIKYANRKVLNFSNWQSFTEHKWYEAEPINNIVITWEFNAMFPNSKVAHRHTLMVKLSNRLKPEEMLNLVFTGKIEEIEELDNNFFPVVARVDFVDRVLGVMFLKRHKAKFATLSNLITNIVFMISSVLLTGKFVLKMGFSSMAEITTTQLVHIIYSVFCCVVIWILSSKMSGFISDQLFERLKMYGKSTKLQIGGHYILSNR